MTWVNEELARQFREIATLLKLAGEDTFRVRAYERSADAIGATTRDLSMVPPEELGRIKGIGASTARKITEYLGTGAIGLLEDLREKVPPGMVELTRIPGLGPKTAKLLFERLGMSSLDALRDAIEAGQLRDLPGLGEKTEANLRAALERMGAKDVDRVPAAEALSIAHALCDHLRALPQVVQVAYAGSLRRMRETIGDVDLLVASTEPGPVMEALRTSDLVREVIAAGEKKTSVITVRGIQVDLRVTEPEAWGAALVYFTGSKAHNVRIRERAVRRGLTLNEYGLFERGSGERVASHTEQDVYTALGLAWVPAPMREDTGEVEAAAAGTLPRVVRVEDLRGDLHGHSDWSGDGKASLEDMVTAAAARGYAYWAVTDHAEGLSMNGLSREQVLSRREVINALQDGYPDLRILDGVELNIGIDGALDYDLDFLLAFDFCVASIHTLMSRPAHEQTERIIRAIQHPAVHVIGHPTGRKIGHRPGYDIDLDAIVQAAEEYGVALEVNASPWRLDLGGDLVRRVVEAGAALAISCDAHSVGDLANMPYGVATAQRGWAAPDQILNCRDLDGLLAFVEAKRATAR
ncbi:MAG: DNA polymerase/3'-5' exonuclease PolX [Egibacteraceae bacterium]